MHCCHYVREKYQKFPSCCDQSCLKPEKEVEPHLKFRVWEPNVCFIGHFGPPTVLSVFSWQFQCGFAHESHMPVNPMSRTLFRKDGGLRRPVAGTLTIRECSLNQGCQVFLRPTEWGCGMHCMPHTCAHQPPETPPFHYPNDLADMGRYFQNTQDPGFQ